MLSLVPTSVALLALSLPSATQEVARGPAPAWVETLELPEPVGGPASGGVEFLLQDAQDDLRDTSPVRYRRLVTRVAGAAGVDSESRVTIEFDPQAEGLTLHRVAVHRGEVTSERLDALELRVLQRETGLDELMLDGRVTALAILDDVRVDDMVEVAYSLSGRKAVFGERWFDDFPTAWGVALGRLHRRVLTQPGRELGVRLFAGAPQPERRTTEDALELVWDLRDVPAVPLEENVPGWHDVLPWVQLSEYSDWPELARWGAELFAQPEDASAGVRALAEELAAASDDPLERTRLALRRVQSDVRYLGLMFGEGSHRPRAPEEVLARRFGDCKDKALLLCALLGELGVAARPALVNTLALHSVGEQLPSPGAFDHAIVRALVAGEELWLDPTQSSERGPIDEWTLPAYGWALLLDLEQGDLVEVVRERGQVPAVQVAKHYVLDAARASTLEVVTTYSGARANAVREGLESLGAGDLERMCQQYTAEQHPRIEIVGPPEVVDDLEANRLSVRERYHIPDLWDGERWATLGCVELAGELIWPVAVQRTQPFALPHPGRYEQHLTAELAGLGPAPPLVTRVGDEAFRFESRVSASRDTLSIDASLEILRDHVLARDVPRYADALERAERSLYRDIARPGAALAGIGAPQGDELDATQIGQAIVGLGFLFLIALAAAHRMRTARRAELRLLVEHDEAGARAPQPFVDGRTLVLARGVDLPERCVACNGPAATRRTQRVQWHSPWLYVLFLAGILLYFLAAAVASSRDTVRIALCARHDRRRRLTRWAAGAGAAAGLALLVAAIQGPGVLAAIGLAVLLLAGVVSTQAGPHVRASYMDARTLHLRGFGRAYLDSIESSTSVGNEPDARRASSTALRSAA